MRPTPKSRTSSVGALSSNWSANDARDFDLAQELAEELHAVGAMDKVTLRMIGELRAQRLPAFTAADVRRIRAKTRLSQPLFAIALNVGRTTVAQWEQGLKKPSGPSARLLDVIDRKGIEAVA